MASATNDARRIFLSAAERPPEERADFLAEACGEDAALRQRVEALLRAHDEPGAFLSEGQPGLDVPLGATQQQEPLRNYFPGALIAGRYKLVEAIGEGGMGTVWLAEQKEPVKRKVAVKLVKAGMDSRAVLARFEAERQALAMMDHPNIARVFDGGMTDQGRPYFVMELVRGIPLTEYCDQVQFSVRERLELFGQVCSAVQHAHQKGIIHRDLKPKNLLVTEHDGRPIAKVIDFGLAKALHGSHTLTEMSMHTSFGAVLGTPLYMAPEQLGTSALDVDTRADLYSLGVILYELLTGTTPIERQRLKDAAWDEIRRIVREEEPPQPSTRLSSSGSLPSLAARRHVEPSKLTRLVRGELDWIIMKALEKDRNRRYETANSLGQDIQRYLNGDPVQAAPPSRAYRLRKFVRRHRAQVVAATLVLLTLVAGVIGTTFGLVEARRQAEIARTEASAKERARVAEAERAEGERQARLDAQEAQTKAEQAATQAKVATAQAQKRLVQIENVNEILSSIFENLDPREIAESDRPLQAILAEKLDHAVEQLEGDAIGDPLVVAAMQKKFGESLLGLGMPDKALVLLERALATRRQQLGKEHFDSLDSLNSLAYAFLDTGQLDKSLALFEEALPLYKSTLGPAHPETLDVMNNLAQAYDAAGQLDKAVPLCEETLKLYKSTLGPEHLKTLISMSSLASAYHNAGQLDKALLLFEETYKLTRATLGPDHPHTITAMNNLAVACQSAGQLDKALPLFEEALPIYKSKLGAKHPLTLSCMGNLAEAYRSVGQLDKALPLCEETHELRNSKLGPDHPETLISMSNLASAYRDAGQLAKAVPLFEETFRRQKAKLGPEHPNTLGSMINMAGIYQATGRLDEALALAEESKQLHQSKLGLDHPNTLISMISVAQMYRAAGQQDKALKLAEETLQLCRSRLGPEHPITLQSMHSLARAYRAANQLDKAVPLFEDALELLMAQLGPEHPRTLAAMKDLASAYREVGRLEKALPLSEEALQRTTPKRGPQHPETLASMVVLSQTLLATQAFEKAESLCRQCLTIREKVTPDHWMTFHSKSLLGSALLGQKKFAEAEPLLLAGYEGMKQRESTIPADAKMCLTETVQRLVELYEAMGKRQEVAKWQAELDRRQPAAGAPATTP